MQDAEQFADASLRPALLLEPAEVFEREIEQRNAVRRMMLGAIFSERHEGAADVGEIGGEPVAEVFFEAFQAMSRCAGSIEYPAAAANQIRSDAAKCCFLFRFRWLIETLPESALNAAPSKIRIFA